MPNKTKGNVRARKRTLIKASNDLTLEWDYSKNGEVTPLSIRVHDQRNMYWICQHCGGEFQASVKKRYYKKSKCPHCFGKGEKKGTDACVVEQSLGYQFPYLMREWHPELNDHLNAFELSPQSGVLVWWNCQNSSCQHQWRSPVFQRVYGGVECPSCSEDCVVSHSAS